MAERVGFEPTRRFPAYTLSKRAPSTTRPPLRKVSLSEDGCTIAIKSYQATHMHKVRNDMFTKAFPNAIDPL